LTTEHLGRSRSRNARATRALRSVLVASVVVALAACGGGTPSASTSVAADLAAGLAALKAHQYTLATGEFDKVVAAQPKNTYALYDLGFIEQTLGQAAAARSYYEQVLAVQPTFDNSSAMYNLAVLDATSDPVQSKTLYLDILRIYPHDWYVYFNLGKVLLTLHDKAGGDADINLAVRHVPALKHKEPAGS
jgi:Tfp pilus assembly protein PilF